MVRLVILSIVKKRLKVFLGQLYITDASYLPFLCFHFLVIYLRKTDDRDTQLRDGPTFSLVTNSGRLLHWSDPSTRSLSKQFKHRRIEDSQG